MLFRNAERVSCSGAKLFFRAGPTASNRIAFTLVRKYGNAVERNYAKRLGREAYRQVKGDIRGGYDLLLLVYPGGDSLPNRMRQIRTLFSKAGLLKEPS